MSKVSRITPVLATILVLSGVNQLGDAYLSDFTINTEEYSESYCCSQNNLKQIDNNDETSLTFYDESSLPEADYIVTKNTSDIANEIKSMVRVFFPDKYDYISKRLDHVTNEEYLSEYDIVPNQESFIALRDTLVCKNKLFTINTMLSLDEDGNITIESGDRTKFFFVRFINRDKVFFNILKKDTPGESIDLVGELPLQSFFKEIDRYVL